MQGTRLPDGTAPRQAEEYAWMPYEGWEWRPPFLLGDGEWHIIAPDGGIGACARQWREGETVRGPNHTVEIHEDGSITVSPSLVMPSGWHGWLRAGVFSC